MRAGAGGSGSLSLACHLLPHSPPSSQIVLLPRVRELPGLRLVDPGAAGRLQELHAAGCLEAARTGRSSSAPATCARLACSISALLHGGGLGA